MNFVISDTTLTIALQNSSQQWKSFRVEKTDPRYSQILPLLGDTANSEEIINILTPMPVEIVLAAAGMDVLDSVPAALRDKLKAIQREGVPFEPFRQFLHNIKKNPSASSIAELYDFLSYRALPITPDGCFLAYKGVMPDFYSKNGNLDTIVNSGTVDSKGRIYNGIGEIIEVDRNQVDDDRDKECSFGLHVGSLDYASKWADRLILVKVNPADVVSVPKDHSFQKCRVCRYEVIDDLGINADKASVELVSATADIDGTEIVNDAVQYNADYIAKTDSIVTDMFEDADWDVINFQVAHCRVGGTIYQFLNALKELNYTWVLDPDGGGHISGELVY
jgi:hypothetical protein